MNVLIMGPPPLAGVKKLTPGTRARKLSMKQRRAALHVRARRIPSCCALCILAKTFINWTVCVDLVAGGIREIPKAKTFFYKQNFSNFLRAYNTQNLKFYLKNPETPLPCGGFFKVDSKQPDTLQI